MFIYDMGVVDQFQGMVLLDDYIKFIKSMKVDSSVYYLTEKQLKSFLQKCFVELHCVKAGWEGNYFKIALSAVPHPLNITPSKFIVIKQQTKGRSFLVSERPFNFPDPTVKLVSPQAYPSPSIMMDIFHECYDLVEKIFSTTYETYTPTNYEPINNFLQGVSTEIPENKQITGQNIIDFMKDFQKI